MQIIENEVYYHIQRETGHMRRQWQVGQKFFFGNEKNDFFKFYDYTGKSVEDPETMVRYDINTFGKETINYYKTGEKVKEFDYFYKYNFVGAMEGMQSTLEHYIKLVREIVFEEIRKDFFPGLPSRQKGIWVIPNEEDALKYWGVTLGGGKLLKLNLTGKIHRANQEYLNMNTRPLDYYRQQAFRYWSGTSGKNKQEEECLFEGFVEVLEELKLTVNYQKDKEVEEAKNPPI